MAKPKWFPGKCLRRMTKKRVSVAGHFLGEEKKDCGRDRRTGEKRIRARQRTVHRRGSGEKKKLAYSRGGEKIQICIEGTRLVREGWTRREGVKRLLKIEK